MPRGIPGSGAAAKSSTAAINNPVALGKTFEPLEHQIGQDKPRMLSSTGPAREALESNVIDPVDRPIHELDQEKLALMAFFEEPVEVMIHTTSDKSAEQVFELFNNGQREVFRRGETKVVKRKFVEILATRKQTGYEQVRKQDANGVWHDLQVPNTALRYPFSVVKDPNPKGADWLRFTLAMGG